MVRGLWSVVFFRLRANIERRDAKRKTSIPDIDKPNATQSVGQLITLRELADTGRQVAVCAMAIVDQSEATHVESTSRKSP